MIANIFLVLGGLFYLLGGLGILRMPDTFNRIQAGTKATTLGAFALLLGVGIANPEWLFKEPVDFEYLDYIIPAYYVLTTAEAS